MFPRLIELALLACGVWVLFKIARKAWRRSELQGTVEDKLEALEQEKKMAAKVVDINTKEVNRNRKKLNDFEDL